MRANGVFVSYLNLFLKQPGLLENLPKLSGAALYTHPAGPGSAIPKTQAV
jgi:hypothetical protein